MRSLNVVFYMKRVLIPWKMPHYQAINGFHPLFSDLLQHPRTDIEYLFPDMIEGTYSKEDLDQISNHVIAESLKIGQRFSQAGSSYLEEVRHYLETYIETRDIRAQAQILSYSDRADLVFHHTTPLHLSSMPYILHFESLTTLFYPFLLHGHNLNVDLRRELIFSIVKDLLENPACRAIFTHIKSSADILCRSFASDIINAKVSYIPLGVAVPQMISERVEEKLKQTATTNKINILFTNSAHGAGPSFLLRGGHDLLVAFQNHRAVYSESRLTIVSSGRDAFEQVHPDLLQGVEWIDHGIDDDYLFDLLVKADVFALPAAGLHSYSVLRAMRCGTVLICSDAPGYEEFVSEGETALVVKGRLEDNYSCEPDTGWWRDDYTSMKKFNLNIVAQLTEIFNFLSDNPDRRRTIAMKAVTHAQNHHAIEPWGRAVTDLIHSA